MHYYNSKHKIIIRMIAAITLVCFLSYDVVWAHPMDSSASTHTLAPETLITSNDTAQSISLAMLKTITAMLQSDPNNVRLANIQRYVEERFTEIRETYKKDLMPKEEFMPLMADEAEENQIFLRAGNEVLRIFVMGLGKNIPSPQEVLKSNVVEEGAIVPVAGIYGYQILKVVEARDTVELSVSEADAKQPKVYFNTIWDEYLANTPDDDAAIVTTRIGAEHVRYFKPLFELAPHPENWLGEFKGDWEKDFIKEISNLSDDELAEKFLTYFSEANHADKDIRRITSIAFEKPNLNDIYINLLSTLNPVLKEETRREGQEAIWIVREWIYRHWDGTPKERSYDVMVRGALSEGDAYILNLDVYMSEILLQYFDGLIEGKISKPTFDDFSDLMNISRDPGKWINEFEEDWEEPFVKEISSLSANELAEKFLSYYPENVHIRKDLRRLRSFTMPTSSSEPSLDDIVPNITVVIHASDYVADDALIKAKEMLWILREWTYRHWDAAPRERSYEIIMRSRGKEEDAVDEERVVTAIMSMIYSPAIDPINILNIALADLIGRFSKTHTLADSELPGMVVIFEETSQCAEDIRSLCGDVLSSLDKGIVTKRDVNLWYVGLVDIRNETRALRNDFEDVHKRYKMYFSELENADDEEMGISKGFEKALRDLDTAIDVLDNRIRYARGSVQLENIDLFNLVVDAAEYHAGRAIEDLQEGVEISGISRGTVHVDADKISLLGAISNTVNNALVSARENTKGENPRVNISVRRDGNWAVVTIQNNGDRIDPKLLREEGSRAKIFDLDIKAEGHKVEKNAQRNAETWNVIQDHKGEIRVSTSEEGNTFEILLPISKEGEEDLPPTAEGGLVPPDMVGIWIENGEIDKVVAHITRGLQGSQDEMLDEHVRYILEKIGKGEELRTLIRGLKKEEASDDKWKSRTAKSATTLIYDVLLEDFAKDVLYDLMAREWGLEGKEGTLGLARPLKANNLNLARIVKESGELEANDFRYIVTAKDVRNRTRTIAKELLEGENIFSEFDGIDPLSESSYNFMLDVMHSILVENEIMEIYKDDQFALETAKFANNIALDKTTTDEEKVAELALLGSKIIEPLLLGLIKINSNLTARVLEEIVKSGDYKWDDIEKHFTESLKVLISYPGYKNDTLFDIALDFVGKNSSNIDVFLGIINKIPFSEPNSRQIGRVLFGNAEEAAREIRSAWNLFLLRHKYVPLITMTVLSMISRMKTSPKEMKREVGKIIARYVTSDELKKEVFYGNILNDIFKSVLNDESLDVKGKADALIELAGPVAITILSSVDYDIDVKKKIFAVFLEDPSLKKSDIRLSLIRSVSMVLRSGEGEANARAFSFVMDVIGEHGDMEDILLLLGTIKNTGYFYEFSEQPSDEYFIQVSGAIHKVIRNHSDQAKDMAGYIDKILKAFDDPKFGEIRVWIGDLIEKALNRIGYTWRVSEKRKSFFSFQKRSYAEVIPLGRNMLGDVLFAGKHMDEQRAKAIYDKATQEGGSVPAAFLHLYGVAQPFYDFFAKKNEVINETLLRNLFQGPHYLPRIFTLSQDEMDRLGAGGNPVVRYEDAIIISEKKWHEMISKTYFSGEALMNPLLNVMLHEAMAWYAAKMGIDAGELGMLAEGKMDIEDWEKRYKLHKGLGVDRLFAGANLSDSALEALGIIGPEEASGIHKNAEPLDPGVFASVVKYLKDEKKRIQEEAKTSKYVVIQAELDDSRDAIIVEGEAAAKITNTDLTKADKNDLTRRVKTIIKSTELLRSFKNRDDVVRQWIGFFDDTIEFIIKADYEDKILDERLRDTIDAFRKEVLSSKEFLSFVSDREYLEGRPEADGVAYRLLQGKVTPIDNALGLLQKLYNDEEYKNGTRGIFIVGSNVQMPIAGLGYCIEANSGNIYINVNEFGDLVRVDPANMSALAERVLRLFTVRSFLLGSYRREMEIKINQDKIKTSQIRRSDPEWEKLQEIKDVMTVEIKDVSESGKSPNIFIKWLRAKFNSSDYTAQIIEMYFNSLTWEMDRARDLKSDEILGRLDGERMNLMRFAGTGKPSAGSGVEPRYLPTVFAPITAVFNDPNYSNIVITVLIFAAMLPFIYPNIRVFLRIWFAKRVLIRYLKADSSYVDKNGLTAREKIKTFSNKWFGLMIEPSEGADSTIQIDEGIRVFSFRKDGKAGARTYYKQYRILGKYLPIKIAILAKGLTLGVIRAIISIPGKIKGAFSTLLKRLGSGRGGPGEEKDKTLFSFTPIPIFFTPLLGAVSPAVSIALLVITFAAILVTVIMKTEKFLEEEADLSPKSTIEGEIRKYLGKATYFKSGKFSDGVYRLEVSLNPKESDFEGNSYDIKVFFEDENAGGEILAGFLLDIKFTNLDQIMLGWGGSINYPELMERFNSFREGDLLARNMPLFDGMQMFSNELEVTRDNHRKHMSQFLKSTSIDILESDLFIEKYLERMGRNFEGDVIAAAINQFISSVTPFSPKTETSFKVEHEFTLEQIKRGAKFEETGFGRLYAANGYEVTEYRNDVAHLLKARGIDSPIKITWLDPNALGQYAKLSPSEEAVEAREEVVGEGVEAGEEKGSRSISGTLTLIIFFVLALLFPGLLQAAEPVDTQYTYYSPSGRIETMRFPNGWDNDTPGYTRDDYEPGTMATLSNESFYDPGTPVDPTDDYGRTIRKTYPDGSYETYHYYFATDEIQYIRGYDSLDGPTFTHETIVRETATPGFAVRAYTDGSGARYHIANGGLMYPAVERSQDGTIKLYTYDGSWNVTETITYYSDGRAERADYIQGIVEEWTPGSDLTRGANLPWVKYGYDIGVNRFGDPYEGLTTKRAQLIQDLYQWRGCALRVFIFCDLRSGVTFSGNTPTGFTTDVYNDMDTLIEAAQVNGVNLIPVLLDFTLADGVSIEGSTPVGETPSLITNATDRAALISLIGAFVDTYKDSPVISMWEIMNEPEEIQMKGQASWAQLQTFVREFITELHTSGVQVTLGSQDREFLLTYWTDDMLGVTPANGLDVYQFHYYNAMENVAGKELDVSVSSMSVGKPVIIGELDPTQDGDNSLTIPERFELSWNNGYEGVFPWQDDSAPYTLSATDADDIRTYHSTSNDKPVAPDLISVTPSSGNRTFTISWTPYTGALQGSAEGYTIEIAGEEFFVSGVGSSSTVINIPDHIYHGNYVFGIRTEMPAGQTDGEYLYWGTTVYIGESPDEEEGVGPLGCSMMPASSNSLNISFFMPLVGFLLGAWVLRNRQPKSGIVLREQFASWIKKGKWNSALSELSELTLLSENLKQTIFDNYLSKLSADETRELIERMEKASEEGFSGLITMAEFAFQTKKEDKRAGISLASLAEYLKIGFSGITFREERLYETLTGISHHEAIRYEIHEVVIDEKIEKAFSEGRISDLNKDDEALLEVVSFLRALGRHDLINILLKLSLEERIKLIMPRDETFKGHASPRGIYVVDGENNAETLIHEFGAYLHNGHDFNRSLGMFFKVWQKDKSAIAELSAATSHFYETLGEKLAKARVEPLAMYATPEVMETSGRFGVLFRDFQREWNDESTQDEAINPILVGGEHKSMLSKILSRFGIFKGKEEPIESNYFELMNQYKEVDQETGKLLAKWDEKKQPTKGKIVSLIAVKENAKAELSKSIVRILRDERDRIVKERDNISRIIESNRNKRFALERQVKETTTSLGHLEEARQRWLSENGVGDFVEGVTSQGRMAAEALRKIMAEGAIEQQRAVFIDNMVLVLTFREQLIDIIKQLNSRKNLGVSEELKQNIIKWVKYYNGMINYAEEAYPELSEEAQEIWMKKVQDKERGMVTILEDQDLEAKENGIRALEEQLEVRQRELRIARVEEEGYSEEFRRKSERHTITERTIELLEKEYFSTAPGSRNIFICDTGKDAFSTGQTSYIDVLTGNIFITRREYMNRMKVGPFALTALISRHIGEREILFNRIIARLKLETSTVEWLREEAIGAQAKIRSLQAMNSDLILLLQSRQEEGLKDAIALKKEINRIKSKMMSRDELARSYDWMTKWEEHIEVGQEAVLEIERIQNEIIALDEERIGLSDRVYTLTARRDKLEKNRIDGGDKTPLELIRWIEERLQDPDEWYTAVEHGNGLGGTIRYIPNQQFTRQFLSHHMEMLEGELTMIEDSPSVFSSEKEKLINSLRRELLALKGEEKRLTFDDPEHVKKFGHINLSSPFYVQGVDSQGDPLAVAGMRWDGSTVINTDLMVEPTEEFKKWNMRHEGWHKVLAKQFRSPDVQELVATALAFSGMTEVKDEHLKTLLLALNHAGRSPPEFLGSRSAVKDFIREVSSYYKNIAMPYGPHGERADIRELLEENEEVTIDRATDIVYRRVGWRGEAELINGLYREKQSSGGLTRFDAALDKGVFLPSSLAVLEFIAELLLNGRERVLDLGSGNGLAASVFSRRAALSKGIEFSGKLHTEGVAFVGEDLGRVLNVSNIHLENGDYFDEDFSEYDLIYSFWPNYGSEENLRMQKILEAKLLAELSPGAIFVIDRTGNIEEFEGLERIELSEDRYPDLLAYTKPSAESAHSLASVLRNAVLLERSGLAYDITFLLGKWSITKLMGDTTDETVNILLDIVNDMTEKGAYLRGNNNIRDTRVEELSQKTLEDVDRLIGHLDAIIERVPTLKLKSGSLALALAPIVTGAGLSSLTVYQMPSAVQTTLIVLATTLVAAMISYFQFNYLSLQKASLEKLQEEMEKRAESGSAKFLESAMKAVKVLAALRNTDPVKAYPTISAFQASYNKACDRFMIVKMATEEGESKPLDMTVFTWIYAIRGQIDSILYDSMEKPTAVLELASIEITLNNYLDQILQQAEKIAQKILEELRVTTVNTIDEKGNSIDINVTWSMGIAEITGLEEVEYLNRLREKEEFEARLTPEERENNLTVLKQMEERMYMPLVGRADNALLKAKIEGRNRFVVSPSDEIKKPDTRMIERATRRSDRISPVTAVSEIVAREEALEEIREEEPAAATATAVLESEEESVIERMKYVALKMMHDLTTITSRLGEEKFVLFVDRDLATGELQGSLDNLVDALETRKSKNDPLGQWLKTVEIMYESASNEKTRAVERLESLHSRGGVPKKNIAIISSNNNLERFSEFEGESTITGVRTGENMTQKSYLPVMEIILFTLMRTRIQNYESDELVEFYKLIKNVRELEVSQIIDLMYEKEGGHPTNRLSPTIVIDLDPAEPIIASQEDYDNIVQVIIST